MARKCRARPDAAAVGRAATRADDVGTSPSVYPTVTYRAAAEQLPTASIISELVNHIRDAESWSGSIGNYARERAAELRAELRRRAVQS